MLDLRYAAHDDFDRVVIDGPMPDYCTGHVRRFTYDVTGDPIPVAGRSGPWIGLTADDHDAAGTSSSRGLT